MLICWFVIDSLQHTQKILIFHRYNDMEWDNDMIVVLKDVRISPPYTPDNCEGSQIACERIKKQVWIHYNPVL